MRRARLVGPLWRWHRRAGLVAALFLLALASSGLLLNHSTDLGLDKRRVEARLLRTLYDGAAAPVLAFAAGSHWLAQAGDGELLLDATPAGDCAGRIVGAREWQGTLVVACEHALALMAMNGARIETLDRVSGLTAVLGGLGEGEAGLLVRADGEWRVFDTEAMSLGETAAVTGIARAAAPPAELAARISAASGWLSWERLLLDLHSGRILGRWGVLVVDIVGVLAILLALSGIAIWALRRRRQSRD